METTQLQNFEIPIKDGVQGLTSTWFGEHKYMGTLFNNIELMAKDSMLLYYYSLYLISLIPEENSRVAVENKITEIGNKMRSDFTNNGKEITAEDEKHILITSTLKGLGMATGFMDRYVGLSKSNKLSVSAVDCSHCANLQSVWDTLNRDDISSEEKIVELKGMFDTGDKKTVEDKEADDDKEIEEVE